MSNQPVDILCVNETFLDSTIIDNNEVSLSGYTIYRNDRGSRHGGGVAIYIKTILIHEECTSLNMVGSVETCWDKVKPICATSFLVCSMYRPPSATETYFNDTLRNIEAACDVCSDFVLLNHDLNHDYNNEETLSTNLVHYMEQLFMCKQLVTEPTRETSKSRSTLDVILSTLPHSHRKSGVVKCGLRDHHFIYTISNDKGGNDVSKVITFRNYKNFNEDSFRMELRNEFMSHDGSLICDDVNYSWSLFKDICQRVCNNYDPIHTCRAKGRNQPRINGDLIRAMFQPEFVIKRAIKPKSDVYMANYRALQNKVCKDIKAQKNYIMSLKF